MSPRHPVSRRFTLPAALLWTGLAFGPAGGTAVADEQVPQVVTGGKTVVTAITPAGDVDAYEIGLFKGDRLTIRLREGLPEFGINAGLELTAPQGNSVDLPVRRGRRGSRTLRYLVADDGVHTLDVTASNGSVGGSTGDYAVTFTVRRARPVRATENAAEGGDITYRFAATEGALVTLSARTRRGGLALTELIRPDGEPEAGFDDALRLPRRGNRSARLVRFPLTGGHGTYELRGTYEPGSRVTIAARVKHGDRRETAHASADEPGFDPLIPPFPDQGIAGTMITVTARDVDVLFDDGGTAILPRFALGGEAIPPAGVLRLGGTSFRFAVPAGLIAGRSYDLLMEDTDGQRVLLVDAFYFIPPPTILSLDATEGGPAGGRHITISGQDLRPDVVALFGTFVTQPDLVLPPDRVDVTSPANLAPGVYDVTLRDAYGQTSTLDDAFTVLDVGSNRLDSIDPEVLQALGGEVVTIDGADFGDDTVLTLDGAPLTATRLSPTQYRFTSDPIEGGTHRLKVIDDLEQMSTLDVDVVGFDDDSTAAIPAPLTTSGAVDGWRGTRLLVGDVDGDDIPDLVILRPESAFGPDVDRSRVRVLLGDGNGAFSDVTDDAIPAVSATDDWRADDGVLADVDGQDGLDIVLVTQDGLALDEDDEPTRSSLRILMNDGTGVFTDMTSSLAPALTDYGDHNQGVAVVAADVDGLNGIDLVVAHPGSFKDVTVIPDPDPPPEPDPPNDTIITDYYPGLRVFLNDGNGAFTLDVDALPAVDETDVFLLQADELAAGDLTGDGKPDLVLCDNRPLEDPQNEGTYLRATRLLENDGGSFTDVSASTLPAASGPEYLQASRVLIADADGDDEPDIVLVLATRLVDPVTGSSNTDSATRILSNDGSGDFTGGGAPALPGSLDQDHVQGGAVAVGDISGDGEPDLVVVAGRAPNTQERAARVLRRIVGGFVRAGAALPDPNDGDDYRGADVQLLDVDDDGDLDILIVRDEADESVRNLRVLVNPLE